MPLALDRANLDLHEPGDFAWTKPSGRSRSARRVKRTCDVILVGDILRTRPDIPSGRFIPSSRTKRVIATSLQQVKSLDVFLADYEDAQVAGVDDSPEGDLVRRFASLDEAAEWFDLPRAVESLEDIPGRTLSAAPNDDDWGESLT